MRKYLPAFAEVTMLLSLTGCGDSFSAAVCDGLVEITVTSDTIPSLARQCPALGPR
jgi:hypothetical protein